MDHDETWSGKRRSIGEIKQNGDFSGKTVFKKRTSYHFQQTSIFGENVLKEISYKKKTDLWEKDLKAHFSFSKGYRCFRKYTGVMKSYKILLIFLQQQL